MVTTTPSITDYGILPAGPHQQQLDLGITEPPPPGTPHPDGGEMPHWIHRHITEHGTQRPRWGTTAHYICGHCHHIVINWSGDHHPGYEHTIDPTPLDSHAELACQLTGRKTYIAHIYTGSVHIIDTRDQWNMTRKLPQGQHAFPAHKCGARFPGFHTPPAPPAHHSEDDIPY